MDSSKAFQLVITALLPVDLFTSPYISCLRSTLKIYLERPIILRGHISWLHL